jgi:hypothetical protein
MTMLTESHLRRLSVTMRRLEDALLEIEAALKSPTNLIMSVYEDDVPHSAQPVIRENIRRIREEIRIVKARYGLGLQVTSNRQRMSTKLSLLSVDLTETTSRYMRGFGEVPEDEQRPLDDQIGKVISLVDNLNKLVSTTPHN